MPSSISRISSSLNGVHYVNVGDLVRFAWAGNGQDRTFFSIATCIFDGKLGHTAGLPAMCGHAIFIGNITSFTLGGDQILPGKAGYIQVCIIDAECNLACKNSNTVVMEEVNSGKVQAVKVTSISATPQKTASVSSQMHEVESMTWTVQMEWKLSNSYVKGCAVCLLDGPGETNYCKDSDLEQGQIEIPSQSSLGQNAAFGLHAISVQVTTISGRIILSASESIVLDLTGPVCTFQPFRTNRECLEGENCRKSPARVYALDEYVFQSSVTSLRSKVNIADLDTGVEESRWSIV